MKETGRPIERVALRRALSTLKVTPREVVTDAAAIYPGACRVDPVGVASRRAVCQQSDRGRSQSARTPPLTDAQTQLDVESVQRLWRAALALPEPSGPQVWLTAT
jgi:hypothetical protein